MTKTEREDLIEICQLRTLVAKQQANTIAAQRKAAFEQELATFYSFDSDEVWRQAYNLAFAVEQNANEEIRQRAKEELGIPPEFAPELSQDWCGHGGCIRQRREDLTKIAYTKIEQSEREAKLQIDLLLLDVQKRLLAEGLDSNEASTFLQAMPTIEQLIPAITLDEANAQLRALCRDSAY